MNCLEHFVFDLMCIINSFAAHICTSTGTVFIDLRKAFDTVDHAVLLDKLSNLGIVADKEHGWFMDYLSNRTQVVEFQGVTSTPEAISVGVPQGSILRPLLFILHINDLPVVVSECNILMYADDTVLYYSSSKASIIQDKLIANLSKIEHWLSFNSLFINVSKTEAMLFRTAPRLSAVNSFSITLNNNNVFLLRNAKVLYGNTSESPR